MYSAMDEERVLNALKKASPHPLPFYDVMAEANLFGWDAAQIMRDLCKAGKVQRMANGYRLIDVEQE
jgi:hypothetical protein